MKIDLREKIKKEKTMQELPKNHRVLFEKRLKKELPQKSTTNFSFLKIAASILLIMSLALVGYQLFKTDVSQEVVQTEVSSEKKINSMADISPDLKKIEDYYLTNIKYQISKIKITDENKDLLEVYLSQLGILQEEYKELNATLISDNVNEETLDALIENLQLRLQLLKQLKKKLEKIETLKLQENESKKV
jgi:hypothetical protein